MVFVEKNCNFLPGLLCLTHDSSDAIDRCPTYLKWIVNKCAHTDRSAKLVRDYEIGECIAVYTVAILTVSFTKTQCHDWLYPYIRQLFCLAPIPRNVQALAFIMWVKCLPWSEQMKQNS